MSAGVTFTKIAVDPFEAVAELSRFLSCSNISAVRHPGLTLPAGHGGPTAGDVDGISKPGMVTRGAVPDKDSRDRR